MGKNEIIENIHILVSNNVIGGKQALSRYKGFRGELFLEDYLKETYSQHRQLEGGIIISKDSQESSLINSIYLSVIPKESFDDDYVMIFKILSGLQFQKMYLIVYSDNDWKKLPVMIYENETISLSVPEFKIYEFNIGSEDFVGTNNRIDVITDFFESVQKRVRNSYPVEVSVKEWFVNNMNPFTREQLLKIYMNRLFLDGYIGFGKSKGKPSDIDMIVKDPEGNLRLIEVKEKDLPKYAKKGFGLDVPRLSDLQKISKETNLPYYLIVRHINNQSERKLLGWKYILIEDFAKNVEGEKTVTGGTGMRSSYSQNYTLICSFHLFRDL